MRDIRRLLASVRAISPHAEVRFVPVPDNEDMWALRVMVGDVILIETGAGLVDVVLPEASRRIESMSQRMLKAVRRRPKPPVDS